MAPSPSCQFDFVSLNPSADLIAIVEGCKLSKYQDKENSTYYYQLSIKNAGTGSSVIRFKNVGHGFAFSPSGASIVFSSKIAGERGTPAPPGYEDGIWIYNFRNKAKNRISEHGLGYYQSIVWSCHDANIYVDQLNHTGRYNVQARKWEDTPYKGINFSSDGHYYTAKITERPYWTIYRAYDNAVMAQWMRMIEDQSPESNSWTDFEFWSGKLNSVVFVVAGQMNVIFDVRQGKVLGKFQGDVMGINSDGSLVAVHPPLKDKPGADQSKVEIIDLAKFKK